VVLGMTGIREVSMLLRLCGMAGGELGLLRGRLVIARAVRIFGSAMMSRRALVMICGLAMMLRCVL
jgi:hypothetical protein